MLELESAVREDCLWEKKELWLAGRPS